MANIEGSAIVIQASADGGSTYTTIGCQQDTGIDVTGNTIEALCKNGGAWSDSSVSTFGWTANFTANFDVSHTYGAEEIFTAMKAKTTLDYRWVQVDTNGDPVVGGPQFDGQAAITGFSPQAPADGFFTYDVTLTGKGELDLTLVTT